MNKETAASFVKLGTAVRYLKDVLYKITDNSNDEEPLGEKNVLQNIETVLKLIKELGFKGVTEAGDYKNLQKLENELKKARDENQKHISVDQAKTLHELANKIRSQLISSGEEVEVFYLDKQAPGYKAWPGWLSNWLMGMLSEHPRKLVLSFVGVLVSAFLIGIGFSETVMYQEIKNKFSKVESVTQVKQKKEIELNVDGPEGYQSKGTEDKTQ